MPASSKGPRDERLDRTGLVRRDPHPTDRRRILVARTPEGDRALDAAQRVERELFPEVADGEGFRAALLAIIRAEAPGGR